MMIKKGIIFFSILFSVFQSLAQNTLPDFSIDSLGKGKIRISWTNPFGAGCIQLSVQRSYDSSKNFRTIISPQSPELPQNGFIDNDYAAPYSYYRIFYVLSGGAYYFSRPKKISGNIIAESGDPNQLITVYFHDTVFAQLHYADYKIFSDSIIKQTRDSLLTRSSNEVVLKSFIASPGNWLPSLYVYTDRTGNININIPDAKKNSYSINFYGLNDKEIFSVRHLEYTQLVLDKASFMHSGWFTFELFENGKLKERNKFFLQKEF